MGRGGKGKRGKGGGSLPTNKKSFPRTLLSLSVSCVARVLRGCSYCIVLCVCLSSVIITVMLPASDRVVAPDAVVFWSCSGGLRSFVRGIDRPGTWVARLAVGCRTILTRTTHSDCAAPSPRVPCSRWDCVSEWWFLFMLGVYHSNG